jgi:DNA-binding response OmpR family regulator
MDRISDTLVEGCFLSFAGGKRAEMGGKIPIVLLVEDDPDHELLVEFALRRASLGIRIRAVPNGAAAIQYLSCEPPFNDREAYPIPALIILDLNLPIVSGFEVLEWLQSREDLWEVPVVVFSASDDPEDSKRAFSLGARAYRVKSEDFDVLADPVREILKKWVKLP